MGKAQREKGKRGERELAGILRDYGYDTRRGQQFCGADGSAEWWDCRESILSASELKS